MAEDRQDPAEGFPTEILGPRQGPDLPPGTVVAGRYRVLETLGVGGMGVVYRVHDNVLDIELALKMLRPEMAGDQGFLERFRNELLVARQVTHRHVVRNHDLGVHEGSYFITMDLVRGRPLDLVLKSEGRLEPGRAIAVVRQVAAALAEAHRQGVVHRDLKPANILLDDAGDAYVTDFGIARSVSSAGLTRTGEVVGTPDYLSPEQARGEKVDGRSDLYTLGLIFVEMLTGKLPFPGGTLFEVLAQRMRGKVTDLGALGVDLPPALEAVIEHALEPDPERRYQSAAELIADLDAFAGEAGPRLAETRPAGEAAAPMGRRTAGRRTAGRRTAAAPTHRGRRALAWGAAALLALGLAGVALKDRLRPAGDGPAGDAAVSTAGPANGPETAAAVAEPRHSVAVLPFAEEAERSDLRWAASGVAEMLATALAESGDLRVVESVRVAQILQDLGFEPGRLRPEEIAQLAEFLRVDRVVLGKLRAAGDRLQLEMSLLESEPPGGSPRVVDSRDGRVEELFDLVEELGDSLRRALAVPLLAEASPSPTRSAAAIKAYGEGVAALSRGESLAAAPALRQAVEEDPSFTLAWVRLSQAYQDLGHREEALEASRQAVRSAGGAGGRIGYEARAQEALLRGEPEQAQSFLEELVERYPNDFAAHVALAEAYGRQGKLVEAKARLERAVTLDPSEPRAWYQLGRFAIMTGEIQRAVDEYLVRALAQQRRLGNEQGQAEVLNAQGVGYQRLGLTGEAVTSYAQAAEIRRRIGDLRGLAVSLHNLGIVRINLGDYDAAEENLLAGLEIHRQLGNQAGIGKLTNSYGLLQEMRGRYGEALELYRRSLQVRDELGDQRAVAESHLNLGSIYSTLGQYDNALLYLGKARELYEQIEDRGGVLWVLPNLGVCELARGNWSQAVASFLETLDLSRELGDKASAAFAHGDLGLAAVYQGRYGAGFTSYRDALSLLAELSNRRGQAEIALRQAEALLEVGAAGRAAERLDQTAAWEPSRNPAQRSRRLALRSAWHLERGETVEALRLAGESLEEARATQAVPLVVAARIGTGRGLIAAGETERALDELRSALEEAERIGNAVLELAAGEALGAAALAAGDAGRAEEVLRRALRLAEKCGSHGRAFRLHQLLAAALAERGDGEGAEAERGAARAELERVRENLDDELRRSFDRRPEVRELLAGGAAGGGD